MADYLLLQSDARRIPLPDQSVSLVIGSPPYIDARLYLEDGKDLGISLDCAAWIEWMLGITAESLRVSRGLVLWVVAGVTRGRNYQPGPEGLLYRWWAQGGECHCLRPVIWHRSGIPGSGGDEWFRADTEYVLAFKRPGKLPWSDNLANGKPCGYPVGGNPSHRDRKGDRVNLRDGGMRRANGDIRRHGYTAPGLANPGNLITTEFLLSDLIDMVRRYEEVTSSDPREVLRGLRDAIDSQEVSQWFHGIYTTVLGQEILQRQVHRKSISEGPSGTSMRNMRNPPGPTTVLERDAGGVQGDVRKEVLLPQVQREGVGITERPVARGLAASGQEDCPPDETAYYLRDMRNDETPGGSPQERRCDRQYHGKFESPLPVVPPEGTCESGRLSGVWESADSLGLLQQALPEIQEVWQSLNETTRSAFCSRDIPGLISIPVGGGLLGHKLAHLSEAAYPVDVPKWFIASHCEPGGLILDPFSGSGTTADAAISLGRRAIGLDIRRSQCELGHRRIVDSLRPVSRYDPPPPLTPLPGQGDLFSYLQDQS